MSMLSPAFVRTDVYPYCPLGASRRILAMMKNVIVALLIAMCCLTVGVPAVSAEEPKFELKSPAVTIKDILLENIGKRLILRLETGENLEGTVSKVGDSVVHIAKLSGKDFYDAVVRIDRISAVIFKVRG